MRRIVALGSTVGIGGSMAAFGVLILFGLRGLPFALLVGVIVTLVLLAVLGPPLWIVGRSTTAPIRLLAGCAVAGGAGDLVLSALAAIWSATSLPIGDPDRLGFVQGMVRFTPLGTLACVALGLMFGFLSMTLATERSPDGTHRAR